MKPLGHRQSPTGALSLLFGAFFAGVNRAEMASTSAPCVGHRVGANRPVIAGFRRLQMRFASAPPPARLPPAVARVGVERVALPG